MLIRLRGQYRFGTNIKPNDLTLTRKHGDWFASITVKVDESACRRERGANLRRGLDFGLTDWAMFDDGETIANPCWLRKGLPKFKNLQQQWAKKRKGSLCFVG